MKKKLVALVALAAMVLSMLPVAAFADGTTTPAKDINIYVTGYDSNVSGQDVSVSITGKDLKVGMAVYWRVDNVSEFEYLGDITKTTGQNNFYIKKADIPELTSADANDLTIAVMDDDLNRLALESFEKEVLPVAPSSMKITVDTKGGTSNRTFTVTFDDDYVMGENDELAYQQYDKDGDAVPGTNTKYVDITSVKDGKFTFTKSFDEDTASVKFTFERNGVADKDLTATVKLESPYGELKELDYDFGSAIVKQGEKVSGTVYYVNTDGKRTDITDEVEGYFFSCDDNSVIASSNTTTGELTIADNAKLGSVIKANAFYNGKTITTSLTVVSDADPGDVKMNRTSYNAGEELGLEFTLLDDKGQTKKLDFFPSNIDIRWIDSSVSDPGFRVNLTDHGASITTKGKFLTSITCDKPCTGKFEITFTDDKGHAYQVVSDTFTFKDPDAEPEGAEKVVVTIGSTTMQVDGKNKTIIAPPIIDNGRTYVPLRAISEAFGATVDWKQATNLITIDRGDTHIVMTPYKLAYTLNGQEKMMDVAPYISTAYASTMVPVRFIADAFGFDSIPEYNADNTTRAVTFTVK
ncbi:MAG: copper amine oxidase N-terminal domain-containing protein [Peptococcaceae bacterium]|nr:copper amine oxidase N-terminal domain-containing protein [Peptococcaceae bacterium]